MCKKIYAFAAFFTGAPGGWHAARPAALPRGLRRASPPCSRTGADTQGQGTTKPRFYRGLGPPKRTGRDKEGHPVTVRLRSKREASPSLVSKLQVVRPDREAHCQAVPS